MTVQTCAYDNLASVFTVVVWNHFTAFDMKSVFSLSWGDAMIVGSVLVNLQDSNSIMC